MKKRLVAAGISMAVLLGMAVRTQAGVSEGSDTGAGQAVWNMSSERMRLNAIGDSSERVVSVSIGGSHSGAVTADGNLYMWGDNFNGECGNGEVKSASSNPVKVLENVRSVSLGEHHSGAVTEDGSLYMWGWNYYGQLGDGTKEDRSRPVKVLEDVVSVSLGAMHSGAVTEDGSLYMWGWNEGYELGDGTEEEHNKPVKVLENVRSVSLGWDHSAAVTKDGSLYIWGADGYTERENNGSVIGVPTHLSPEKIMENVRSVSLGGALPETYGGVVTEDGSLYMWGSNNSGQLGDGTKTKSSFDYKKPLKVMENVQSVSLGDNRGIGGKHSGAVAEDGSLYMWGSNDSGQLGDGTREDHSSPVKVMENVQTISLGDSCSGAVTKDGSLYMWGNNLRGQLGDRTYEGHNRPVKISLSSVQKNTQKITYRSSAIQKGRVAYGSIFSLNAATTGAGKLTYKSSDSSILSIDASGTVAVKGYGPAYIKIKASGGNGYKSAVRKFKLTAVPKRGKVTKAVQENGAVRFRWKPEKTAGGYEYAFAYNKKFSGQIRKKTSKTGLILTKYKTGTKKMYFKVRTYKKVEKKTYYGSWSKVRLLKLKKMRKAVESSYRVAN